jgi:hypothetical protein
MKSSMFVGCTISFKVTNFAYKIIAFGNMLYYLCLMQSFMTTHEMGHTKQRHFDITNFDYPMTDESKECTMIWRGLQIKAAMYWKGQFTELLDN